MAERKAKAKTVANTTVDLNAMMADARNELRTSKDRAMHAAAHCYMIWVETQSVAGKTWFEGKVKHAGKTVALVSGGNIDPMLMQRIVAHGLAASERYLKLRIMLPDRPGQLAETSRLVAEANANVVEVLHTRHGKFQINEAELELHIETRGPEHRKAVIKKLRDAGYQVRALDDI